MINKHYLIGSNSNVILYKTEIDLKHFRFVFFMIALFCML